MPTRKPDTTPAVDMAGMTIAELAEHRDAVKAAFEAVEREIASRHGEVDPTPEAEGEGG